MSRYKVKILEAADKQVWNRFVDHSPWGDILQMWEWGEAKKREGWRPIRVAVIEEGKLRLTAQILLKEVPFLGSYAYIPHGPVVHSTENLTEVFKHFTDYLIHASKTYDFVSIEMDPKLGQFIPDDEHVGLPKALQFYTNSEFFKALESNGVFKTGRNMQPVYKLMYDLSESDDELLAHCNKSTRYNVRYAEKHGVEVKEYTPDSPEIDAKLDQFYDLLMETKERAKGYPVRAKQYFKQLFELFKGTEHVVLTEASYEGDLIAMNISQRTKYWSSSFYAGSNRQHSKLKAPHLMRWKSIKSAQAYGSQTYDFWGIIPDSDQHSGYSSNKLGFGGYRLDTYGLLAIPLNPLKYSLWNNGIWLRTEGMKSLRQFVWNVRKDGFSAVTSLFKREQKEGVSPIIVSPETVTEKSAVEQVSKQTESKPAVDDSTSTPPKEKDLKKSLLALTTEDPKSTSEVEELGEKPSDAHVEKGSKKSLDMESDKSETQEPARTSKKDKQKPRPQTIRSSKKHASKSRKKKKRKQKTKMSIR
jgi:peptidoglycan pentaglycine glycine transferase (the first glycine)